MHHSSKAANFSISYITGEILYPTASQRHLLTCDETNKLKIKIVNKQVDGQIDH